MSRYSREPNCSLILRNLADGARTEELKDIFGKYGPLKDVYVPLDYYTRRQRGFAYVQYEDPRDAKDAKDDLDGTPYLDSDMRIDFARGDRKTPGEMRTKERGGRRDDRRNDDRRGRRYDDDYDHRRRDRSRSRSRDRRRRSRSHSRDYRRDRSDSHSRKRRNDRSGDRDGSHRRTYRSRSRSRSERMSEVRTSQREEEISEVQQDSPRAVAERRESPEKEFVAERPRRSRSGSRSSGYRSRSRGI